MLGAKEQPVEYPNAQTVELAKLLQMKGRFEVPVDSMANERDDCDDGVEFGEGLALNHRD